MVRVVMVSHSVTCKPTHLSTKLNERYLHFPSQLVLIYRPVGMEDWVGPNLLYSYSESVHTQYAVSQKNLPHASGYNSVNC